MFVKDYALNHMPDPKGERTLKENNSEFHYGICSKVYQFIYILVWNYMPNIGILAKPVFKILCSQGCSYTKCLCPKKGRGITQLKIYGISSKVYQFIYILICNYMQNIRILALVIFPDILLTRLFIHSRKKGHNFRTTRPAEEKNMGPLIFHVHATYKISRF